VLASTTGQPIATEPGMRFDGLVRLADVDACALLCVPGGYGCVDAMGDQAFLGELRRLAAGARYLSSVCTGSLLLGAAGLLQGRRAACHWAWREGLRAFGAIPDEARVVRDGNVFSGGGVTAGIDLALSIMAEVAGEPYAQQVQLAIEYAPQPPFDCGRPEQAPAEVLAAVMARMEGLRGAREAAINAAAQRLRAAPSGASTAC
jgi:transcriptional regulator GlxA family with amidase domain